MLPKRGDPLTPKETEAVELLVDGRNTYQIGAVLGLDHASICRRLKNVKVKLGAATYPELAVKWDRLRRK